jgi:hypothetical protein
METKLEIGAGAGEFGFECSDGFKIGDVPFAEFGIGFHLLFGEMDGLREDAVAGGVERRAFLTLGRRGAFAVLRVKTIGAEAGFGRFTLRFSGCGSGGFDFRI